MANYFDFLEHLIDVRKESFDEKLNEIEENLLKKLDLVKNNLNTGKCKKADEEDEEDENEKIFFEFNESFKKNFAINHILGSFFNEYDEELCFMRSTKIDNESFGSGETFVQYLIKCVN